MTYRNAKLLALAKEAPYCFRCRAPNGGQIIAAHANMESMGKGIGHKAADIPAYLCGDCHDIVDGRKREKDVEITRGALQAEWCRAAVLSMRWALENHPEAFAP